MAVFGLESDLSPPLGVAVVAGAGIAVLFAVVLALRSIGKRRRCRLCGKPFVFTENVARCAACQGLHHSKCWREIGRCAARGCACTQSEPHTFRG